jgi:hypothetical protein
MPRSKTGCSILIEKARQPAGLLLFKPRNQDRLQMLHLMHHLN